MVEGTLPAQESQLNHPVCLPTPLRYTSVRLSQVWRSNYRLDASAYDLEAMEALNTVRSNPYGWVYLWGEGGLVREAYYPGRYKRIYSDERFGVPFYLPSQLEEINPLPTKYLSDKTAALLEKDRIVANNLLLSRSGTIGKCTISSKTTIGKLFSDDVIRISFVQDFDLGYVYAYLNTEVGLKLLQSNTYGTVVDHIEPEHLRSVPIPDAPEAIRRSIHAAVVASYSLRDRSNDLMDAARRLLHEALQLPAVPNFQPENYDSAAGFRNFSVPLSQTDRRLDASYHLPEVQAIHALISRSAREVTTLGDSRVSQGVTLPGRFKRVYVEKGRGVPFIGGKQLLQLNPSGAKYLSLSHHAERIRDELLVEENMCLVTSSGTIGKVQIVPRHWSGWTVNQHVLRIIPAGDHLAGYIYAWLSSPHCYPLIIRQTYGSVIDEIDAQQLAAVPFPFLKDAAVQREINRLVLQANEFRYEAYLKEQEALREMEGVLGAVS